MDIYIIKLDIEVKGISNEDMYGVYDALDAIDLELDE